MAAVFVERQGLNMKKIKKMAFGGVSNAVGNAVRNAVAKAPTPPPDVQKMMAGLPKGSMVAGPGTGLAPKPGMLGGIRSAVNNAVSKAPVPPPQVQKMIDGLPKGSTVAGPGTGMAGLGTAAQANPKIPTTINTSRMLTGNPVTKTVRPFGMKEGGKVSSASKRGDGCAIKGKTKGRIV